MMYCEKCGFELDENAKFCPSCGSRVNERETNEKNLNVEEMVQVCLKTCSPFSADPNGRTLKNWPISLTQFFTALQDEMQDDEKCLLYFAGMHQFKSMMSYTGAYSYILTNKRLLMCGACTSFLDGMNYYRLAQAIVAHKFPCRKQSLYLRDLTGVQADMVGGKDVLTFTTVKGSFNVMIRTPNATHRLCTQIHRALDGLENTAGC